jgi:TatD DNase family protein
MLPETDTVELAIPRYVDCHVHLQNAVLSAQLEAVLTRAAKTGVTRFVCNGVQEEDWPQVHALAQRFPEVIPCFGLHPWYVGQRSAQWQERLESFLDQCPSAVGEIGVDQWIEPRDELAQEEVFRTQLHIARQRQLPVMIHCVRAWGWLLDILRSEAPLPVGMLIHAYGGPCDLIKPLAEMGAYFSFGGNTLDDRNARRRIALPHIPAGRLLLETDAPDILPPPAFRPFVILDKHGKAHNEPANLPTIARGIAALLNISEQTLAEQNWQNARRFLGPLWK